MEDSVEADEHLLPVGQLIERKLQRGGSCAPERRGEQPAPRALLREGERVEAVEDFAQAPLDAGSEPWLQAMLRALKSAGTWLLVGFTGEKDEPGAAALLA